MPEQQQPYQADFLSIESALLRGGGKNFQPVIMSAYYKEKTQVSERLLDGSIDRATILSLTRRLLEYVPSIERHDELLAEFESTDRKYMEQRAAYFKIPVGQLSDSERIESARRASEIIRYKVQLEVNQAHGLVRDRGIGCGFPWAARGQSIFPLSEIPPDGTYIRKDTDREYTFRIRGILTRQQAAEPPQDDVDVQESDTIELSDAELKSLKDQE
jgi:hypothetical protein